MNPMLIVPCEGREPLCVVILVNRVVEAIWQEHGGSEKMKASQTSLISFKTRCLRSQTDSETENEVASHLLPCVVGSCSRAK
jgi:hypothetical protein